MRHLILCLCLLASAAQAQETKNEQIEKWIRDLREEDIGTREQAMLELFRHFNRSRAKIERQLIIEEDSEAKWRLEWVQREGRRDPRARELEARIPELNRLRPGIADAAYSKDIADSFRVMRQAAEPVQYWYPPEEQVRLVKEAAIINIAEKHPDWSSLDPKYKHTLLYNLSDKKIAQNTRPVKALQTLLQEDPEDEGGWNRGNALNALSFIQPVAETEKQAFEILKNPKRYAGSWTISALQEAGSKALAWRIRELAKHPDSDIREAVLDYLEDIFPKEKETVEIFTASLQDPYAGNAMTAIQVLEKWGLAKTYEAQIRAILSNPNAGHSLRYQAMETLLRLNPPQNQDD